VYGSTDRGNIKRSTNNRQSNNPFERSSKYNAPTHAINAYIIMSGVIATGTAVVSNNDNNIDSDNGVEKDYLEVLQLTCVVYQGHDAFHPDVTFDHWDYIAYIHQYQASLLHHIMYRSPSILLEVTTICHMHAAGISALTNVICMASYSAIVRSDYTCNFPASNRGNRSNNNRCKHINIMASPKYSNR
jgi:hypothetical protein